MSQRPRTIVSSEEFAKLKAEKALKDTKLPEGPELIEGRKYQLASYDIVEVRKIDEAADKIHIFNFTQNCNTYPRLSTFKAKSFI